MNVIPPPLENHPAQNSKKITQFLPTTSPFSSSILASAEKHHTKQKKQLFLPSPPSTSSIENKNAQIIFDKSKLGEEAKIMRNFTQEKNSISLNKKNESEILQFKQKEETNKKRFKIQKMNSFPIYSPQKIVPKPPPVVKNIVLPYNKKAITTKNFQTNCELKNNEAKMSYFKKKPTTSFNNLPPLPLPLQIKKNRTNLPADSFTIKPRNHNKQKVPAPLPLPLTSGVTNFILQNISFKNS